MEGGSIKFAVLKVDQYLTLNVIDELDTMWVEPRIINVAVTSIW